jgi:integrase
MGAGLCESNPVIGTYKPKDTARRDRVLSDAELAAVWKSCRENDYGKIVRLLILTAARRQEVGGMRWSEIENDVWTIPVERSKNGLAHALPLPPPAMQIIERVPQWGGRDWLFGVSGEGYRHWSASKVELDERSGVKGWVIHDLRRTTATRMADLKVSPHVIETVLNHISGHRAGVAGIYNRSTYVDEVRAALERWASHVEKLVA